MKVDRESVSVDIAGLDEVSSVDESLLTVLRAQGAQTMEQLASSLAGISWAQVFMAIDRLSRSGAVSLRPSGRRDYHVSINRAVA